MKLHGGSFSIISDRDILFTYHIWKAFKGRIGTKVKLSTAFHPKKDGQAEHTIHTLEDMLRECVIDFEGNGITAYPL